MIRMVNKVKEYSRRPMEERQRKQQEMQRKRKVGKTAVQ